MEQARLLQFLHGLHKGGLRLGEVADQEAFGAEALEAAGDRALIGGRVADVELILADADIERDGLKQARHGRLLVMELWRRGGEEGGELEVAKAGSEG